MPLVRSGPNWEDQVGASETITIEPIPPQTATQVSFTAASYGITPDKTARTLPGVVAGAKSITFTVIPNVNRLVFGLTSPSPSLETVNIVQGATLLGFVSVQSHAGTGSLRIKGSTSPAAAGTQS